MTQPECFGKLFDQNAAECTGGYDAGYVGTNGAKVRPRCDFYDSCKIRVAVTRSSNQQPIIAPHSLVRPPQQGQPMGPYQRFQPPQQVQQQIQHQQPQYPQQYQYPVVVTQPVQMMPANFGMPAYLSTPEVRQPDETFFAPLGREMFRAAGKALGHSLAAFFDHNAFHRKDE